MMYKLHPVSLPEVKELIKDLEEKKNLEDYLKKFCKMDKEKSEKLAEELKGLNNLKMKDEHVVKIIEFKPSDAEDLNKIFNDVSLNEEEINALLEIIKKY